MIKGPRPAPLFVGGKLLGIRLNLFLQRSSDSSVVLASRYSAVQILWLRWEQPLLAVCGAVSIGAGVP